MLKSLLLATLSLGPVTAAAADTVVAPNAYADQEGYEYTLAIFGNGSNATETNQVAFAASQFGAVPTGALITGIGFRIAGNLPTQDTPVSYSDFTVRIGQPTNGVDGLTTDEAGNLGADTITALTGPLTLPADALVNDGSPTPFYVLNFTNPYVYTGGDVLLTTSYTVAGNDVPFIGLDAIDPFGVVNTVGGNDPAFLRTHFYNAPVTAFVFAAPAAVPEPATWASMIAGFGLVGGTLRRRSARTILA